MSLVDFARTELERAGLFKKGSDYGGMMGDAVLKMIETFAEEGHSGYSARMAVDLFEKLARFQPITPLTGADDEWTEVAEGLWQNKRSPRVFKEADGVAYDSEGIVFEEPNGSRYIGPGSRVDITFPYVPETRIVARPA
jgi:hypothetical protein